MTEDKQDKLIRIDEAAEFLEFTQKHSGDETVKVRSKR